MWSFAGHTLALMWIESGFWVQEYGGNCLELKEKPIKLSERGEILEKLIVVSSNGWSVCGVNYGSG